MSWLATPRDQFTVTANYNDSKYGSLLYYNVIFGRSVTVASLTGKHYLNAPKFVATAAYQHSFPRASSAKVTAEADGKYQTRVTYGYLPAGQTTYVYQDPYAKVNLSLAYASPQDRWWLGAFVRNVTNKAAILSASGGNTPGTTSPWVSLAPPRTYGANFTARF